MSIHYIPMYHPETDSRIQFPVVFYKAGEHIINSYRDNIYESVNLRSYADSIIRVAEKLGVNNEGDSATLYFIVDDIITTSFIRLAVGVSTGDNHRIHCSIYIYDSEGEQTSLFLYIERPIVSYSYTDRAYNEPAKFIDDARNVTQTTRGYRYVVNDLVENEAIFYDPGSGRIMRRDLYSGQPHAATVINAPNLISQTTSQGYYIGKIEYSDPLSPGGESSEEGGTGTFDNSSDGNDFPSAPTLSPVDAGFITLYNPTNAELKALASYMWSGLFDPASFRKLFADPMDAILGLSIVPVAVPDGLSTEVKVGNIGTGIYMTRANATYVTVDCGSINLEEYWGNALDYAPNTKLTIYLPYIGFRQIDVDETMAKSISVKYEVDILTGACVCWVRTQTSDDKNFIAYTYEGNCAVQVPITSNDWSNVISSTIKAVGSVVGMVATSGASAGVQAGAVAAGITNTTNAVMNSKPTVSRSGSFSGSGGQMNIQVPFLVLERPRQSLPQNFNKFGGYPSNIYTASLGSLKGYTEVESIHLEGINATDSELSEIESLLKGGVIL